MEANLKFSLPAEEKEFYLAANAGSMYSVLCEISNHLRLYFKYGGKPDDALLAIKEDLQSINPELRE